jgi:hypothetical protein
MLRPGSPSGSRVGMVSAYAATDALPVDRDADLGQRAQAAAVLLGEDDPLGGRAQPRGVDAPHELHGVPAVLCGEPQPARRGLVGRAAGDQRQQVALVGGGGDGDGVHRVGPRQVPGAREGLAVPGGAHPGPGAVVVDVLQRGVLGGGAGQDGLHRRADRLEHQLGADVVAGGHHLHQAVAQAQLDPRREVAQEPGLHPVLEALGDGQPLVQAQPPGADEREGRAQHAHLARGEGGDHDVGAAGEREAPGRRREAPGGDGAAGTRRGPEQTDLVVQGEGGGLGQGGQASLQRSRVHGLILSCPCHAGSVR